MRGSSCVSLIDESGRRVKILRAEMEDEGTVCVCLRVCV